MRLANLSIKRKQTMIIMGTTIVALLLACAAFTGYEIITFRKAMVQNLSTLAEIVGNNTAGAIDFNDPHSAGETLSALKAEPSIVGGCIFTPDGKLFAQYDRLNDNTVFQPPAKKQDSQYSFTHHGLSLYKPILSKGEKVGVVYLESDVSALYLRLQQYAVILLMVFLVVLVAAFFISARLQRIISEPILQLVQTAHAVARDKNYALRTQKCSNDELGALTDGFNEMLAQIQERDAALEKHKDELENRVKERTGELANSFSLLNATLESTADGILVVDSQWNKITHYNEQFASMWRIPREVLELRDDSKVLSHVAGQIKDITKFVERVKELYDNPNESSFELIELTDGRVFERNSKPQRIGDQCVGRVWSFRDITQRKRAEAELARTEELYRRAISGAGAVPYSYDYKSKSYLFMGEGIKDLIGYSREEITPHIWAKIVKESNMLGETAGLTKDEAARRVAAGEINRWQCDMRVVTASGKTRWISDSSVQTLDESGKPTGSIGILEDITERKQAEVTSRTFSKLGQSLMSSVTPHDAALGISNVVDGLFGWDAIAFFVYSADTNRLEPLLYMDTIDGTRQDVLVTEKTKRVPSPTDQRVIKNGAELILKEGPLTFEAGATPFGNSRPSASIMRVPVRAGKKVMGILSIHSYSLNAYTQGDLDMLQTLADYCGGALERIWAESQLAHERDLLRTLLDNSPDCIYFKDRDSRFTLCSKSTAEWFGSSADSLVGKTNSTFFTDQHASEAQTDEQKIMLTGQPLLNKIEYRKLAGDQQVWLLTNKLPMRNNKGEIVGTFGISKNITSIKEAEASLKKVNDQLVTASRLAGMAEVATSVLHNVGNVLNSVNISTALVGDKIRNSKIPNLAKAVGLMNAHAADLPAFFANDPKGHQLAGYLDKLAKHLAEEHLDIQEELASLTVNVEHIKEIVAMQQNYARVSGIVETLSAPDLVEDALRLNAGALERHCVHVTREFAPVPPVVVEKHKVLQILVNLIHNAKYAVDDNVGGDKRVTLKIEAKDQDTVRILIIDNGVGIPRENLTRIFNHGFTTKKDGHGFGLHSAALAAKEMGGSVTAASDGPGKGATFAVDLPIKGKSD